MALELWFIDANQERIANLNQVLSNGQSNDQRITIKGPTVAEFEDGIKVLLDDLESRGAVRRPLLVFIDPFGAKGFSMATLTRILRLDGAEIFLLLDVDGVDRILGAWGASNQKNLADMFGIDAKELEPIRNIADRGQRIMGLRRAYFDSLRSKRIAERILPFRLYEADGKPLYDLVFLTNNPLGFVKMKEAMWKADESGNFRFVEADRDQQGMTFETHEQRLWRLLVREFSGKKVSGAIVKQFVELWTQYLNKHKTSTLRIHESADVPQNERITVARKNRGPKGFSEHDLITFPVIPA